MIEQTQAVLELARRGILLKDQIEPGLRSKPDPVVHRLFKTAMAGASFSLEATDTRPRPSINAL